MKKISVLIPIVISLLIFSGCNDDNSTWLVPTNDDPMVIEKICDPSNWDAPITSASLDQLIKVTGSNLSNVDTIVINDVGITYPGDAFLVNGMLFIRVPYSVPIVVDNQLKLTDKQGRTISSSLTVSIPEVKLTKMECEYVPDGAELVIVGDYLDLWGFGAPSTDEGGGTEADTRIVKIGDLKAEILTTSKTSITVRVPAGARENSKVTIENEYTNQIYGGAIPCPGKFRDSEWLLENFNWELKDNGTYQIVVPPVSSNSGNPQPISGNYFRYNGNYSAWNWNGITYKNPFPSGAPSDINTNPSKYAVKFEIWAEASMTGNNLAFFFNGQSNVARVGNDSSIKTGQWITYTIPCTSFSSPSGFLPAFEFVMHGGDNTNMNFAVDNIRFSEY